MKRKSLRKQCLERDSFVCQKCKIEDKTGKILEAHHKTPLIFGGEDKLNNLITLCNDCHHFAPNDKKDFEGYMRDEMNGTSTTLIKAWRLVRENRPELIKEIERDKNEIKNKSSNF